MARVRVKTPRTRKELWALSKSALVTLAWNLTTTLKAQQQELDRLKQGGQGGQGSSKTSNRGEKDKEKKKPGRKKGKGLFTNRTPPDSKDVTGRIGVTSPEACPECGAEDLELERYDDAWITDIPEPLPKPEVTHFKVPICNCCRCGRKNIRGKHPRLAADQLGATAHRLGPNVMAAAHTIHYGYGVPVRKTVPILKDLTGITVTQSAITQDAIRRAKGPLKPKYEELRASIKKSPVAHTDDTGMKMGGKGAHLMGFSTPDTEDKPGVSVYQTRRRHRNEEVREVIPSDYEGTMVTDRGRSYDAKEFASVKQQKCIPHILRSIKKVTESKANAAKAFGTRLTGILKGSLDLWHDYHNGRRRGFKQKAAEITSELSHELRDRRFNDPDNQRLLNELGSHHDRGNVLRFLDDPSVPPTNNLQERELKVPIQARKISQGVKNDAGALALDVHSSIIRTEYRKDPPSLIRALIKLYRNPDPA